jgi:hypothetical protein
LPPSILNDEKIIFMPIDVLTWLLIDSFLPIFEHFEEKADLLVQKKITCKRSIFKKSQTQAKLCIIFREISKWHSKNFFV